MSTTKGQKQTTIWEAKDFGAFTRERVVALMKQCSGTRPDAEAAVAASYLASIESNGPNPGTEGIAAALDLLAKIETPFAGDLIWQAAAQALNSRIRIEAIRRAGPVASSPEKTALLRKWSAEGFNPPANFQHDQFSVEQVREAALNAIGALPKPTGDDIDAVLKAMNPQEHGRAFSLTVFRAAIEAYWSCGTATSFDKVVAILTTTNWKSEIGLPIVSLAAKFTPTQLKKHADALRKAMREHAHQNWQDEPRRTERLVSLADHLATPEFLIDWSSSFGSDGLQHGRGKITRKLLDRAGGPSEMLARALLVLARSPQNLHSGSLVLSKLRQVVEAGHGKTVADTIVGQHQQGHNHILEIGLLADIFPSMQETVRAVAGAIGTHREVHDQRRVADKVADGVLTAATRVSDGTAILSKEVLSVRGRQNRHTDQESVPKGVKVLEAAGERDNPVVWAARFAHDPAVGAGAAALLECWLRPEDDLARYTMRVIFREAARANVEASPILERLVQFLLKPSFQNEPVLRQPLERALVDETVVDGKLNRYAIELMNRENLVFEQGASRALAGLSDSGDAAFLLDRIASRGAAGMGILSNAISFHRDGDETLTEKVQAEAIARATSLHLAGSDKDREVEAFARQLHQRFQDMPIVREAAYRACGRLGSFVSIRPLRDRREKERSDHLKTAISESIVLLRDKLARSKPDHAKAEDIRGWLAYVADLGDPALLGQVTGYLRPPHADHGVRRAALDALVSMDGQQALDTVKQFIENTAPEGETLTAARTARMKLEQRNDIGLFDILGKYFDADAEVLDPALDYESLLGTHLMATTTRSLNKAQKLWDDGHWDEFITQINAVLEAMIRHIFRTKYTAIGLDQQRGEKLAGGNAYANMLSTSEFRNAFAKLQSHANTIQSFRRESPTAHAMNKDGTAKTEASADDAEYVRDEFAPAFGEVVKALK